MSVVNRAAINPDLGKKKAKTVANGIVAKKIGIENPMKALKNAFTPRNARRKKSMIVSDFRDEMKSIGIL